MPLTLEESALLDELLPSRIGEIPSQVGLLPPTIYLQYRLDIVEDPMNVHSFAYVLTIPTKENGQLTAEQRQVVPFITAMHVQAQMATGSIVLRESDTPDAMRRLNVDFGSLITERTTPLGPGPLTPAAAANMSFYYRFFQPPKKEIYAGCDNTAKKDRQVKPGNLNGEKTRSFISWRGILKGAAISAIIGALIGALAASFGWITTSLGKLAGVCEFKVIEKAVITCADGGEGARILFQAADCSTWSYDTCTGESDKVSEPPTPPIEQITTGVVVVAATVGGLALLFFLLSRARKERKRPTPQLPPPAAPRALPPGGRR